MVKPAPVPKPLRLLTVTEVAERLACTKEHVRELTRTGKLESVKVGKEIRVSTDAVERFIRENSKGQVVRRAAR